MGVGFVPRVVFSEKEWRRLTPKAQWKKIDDKTLGAAYDRVVYMNKADLCCRRTADNTCAHEVLHLLRPEAREGKSFEAAVDEMVLGREV